MRVGIIGIGNVGSTLGPLWSACGHDVIFGARDPQSAAVKSLLSKCGDRAQAATVKNVFATTKIILLAVRWDDIPEVVAQAEDLNGAILIDCTTPMERKTHRPLLDWNESNAERLAKQATGASVVKCFDTTGVDVMKAPVFNGINASLFLCGDDEESKKAVRQLVEDIGFEPVDAGPLQASRYLEGLAAFWVFLAFEQGFGEDFSFKLLRRGDD
jgi:8-hydroxy-5-deazaflavin:NADPH oxidoreductase